MCMLILTIQLVWFVLFSALCNATTQGVEWERQQSQGTYLMRVSSTAEAQDACSGTESMRKRMRKTHSKLCVSCFHMLIFDLPWKPSNQVRWDTSREAQQDEQTHTHTKNRQFQQSLLQSSFFLRRTKINIKYVLNQNWKPCWPRSNEQCKTLRFTQVFLSLRVPQHNWSRRRKDLSRKPIHRTHVQHMSTWTGHKYTTISKNGEESPMSSSLPAFHRAALCSVSVLKSLAKSWDAISRYTRRKSWAEVRSGNIASELAVADWGLPDGAAGASDGDLGEDTAVIGPSVTLR